MFSRLSVYSVIGVFFIYFCAQLIITPAVLQVLHWLSTGNWQGVEGWIQDANVKPMLNLLMILIMSTAISTYVFIFNRKTLSEIWGKIPPHFSLFMKMLGVWCLAYPLSFL